MKLNESEDEDDLEEESDESEDSEIDDSGDAEGDNVGDASIEINVEELIEELEMEGCVKEVGNGLAAKRHLEEIMERKRAQRELEDFEDYEI